ncbi:MAG: (2Fe-2S) ferredoxin domain-containing protein [Candidatus Melainabacteria bacterium]|nr:(2Fe-2S) ferredoxin domain-containing protein [Candidatus Melainabacteria bacterium]
MKPLDDDTATETPAHSPEDCNGADCPSQAKSSQTSPNPTLAEVAPVVRAPLQRHVFVCSGKSCTANQSQETLDAFYTALKEVGLLYGKRGTLEGRVIVTTCGSVGLCAVGPAVLIYPDGVWYTGVTPADVPEIIAEHFGKGRLVGRLLARQLPNPDHPASPTKPEDPLLK